MLKGMLDEYKGLIKEMFLYGIFGLFSASMDTLSFMLLSGIGLSMLAANFISVNIGITISFLLNTYLNFKRTDSIWKRALSFYGVGYVGLLLSTGIMWFGVSIMKQKEMYVKIISVIVVAGFQYITNKYVTYKK